MKAMCIILSLARKIRVQHSLGKREKRSCLVWKTNSTERDGDKEKEQYQQYRDFSFLTRNNRSSEILD